MELDRPIKAPVIVLQGGDVECSVTIQRRELLAGDDAPLLSAGDEEFVESELKRMKLQKDRVLERVVCMMGLHSLRSSFDKWALATAAAANRRLLAEEEAKRSAQLLEAESGSESDGAEDHTGREAWRDTP